MEKLPELKIGDLVISPPIIQGGMGVRVSLASLAGAVAREGCVGTISAALIGGWTSHNSMKGFQEADIRALRYEIRRAREISEGKGALAVNIMVALTNYEVLVQESVRSKIDLILAGAGLPTNLPKYVKDTKTKAVPIVSSGKAAHVLCKMWKVKHDYLPDALIVEGPLAGGHLGFKFEQLEPGMLPNIDDIVVDVVKVAKEWGEKYGKNIPVIAAGGIYTHEDIVRVLKLGASGVQMATRFVCTNECDASPVFKQKYLECKPEDIVIIKSPVGMPGRAINNSFLERSERGEIKFRCQYQCLRTCVPGKSPYCIAEALVNAVTGEVDKGFVFVGANAHRCDKIVSVKELINELANG
ncbi:MAG: nitronate monooxygenase family protein [Elusimicrobiota bacterium]